MPDTDGARAAGAAHAQRAGEALLARGLFEKGDRRLPGFEADWCDAYPGINAITLMKVRDRPDPRRGRLIPVVSYAAERRIASGQADYWDHATRLELAVLAKDEAGASAALGPALAMVRAAPGTGVHTANNLKLIRTARQERRDDVPWTETLERELLRRAGT